MRFSYGKLGELIKNERTFVMPGGSETYTFEMRWAYDSWNRVLNITYPDSEVVHYDYDAGGQLQSMYGIKDQQTVSIIDFIGYDAMGSRSRIEYGNGTFTDYTYDGYRQRLSQLQTQNGSAAFMDLHYSYDKENNITGIENIAAAVNGLGGVYKNNYTYDDMYRLTAANGTFTDKNSTDFPFTLEMSYTASGNIATKNVTADILSADNTVSQTAYEGNYTYNTGQSHTIATITGTDIDMSFQWDQNGNMTAHNDNMRSLNRYLCWDEENRLMAVKDQNYLSAYVYDAAGERVWKLSGEVTQMRINGVGTIDVANLSNKTLYVSPYVVYNEQGYSKHYYAGAERVSSRLGGGTIYGLKHPINDTVSPIGTDGKEYPELASGLWKMLQRSFTECLDLEAEYISMEFQLPSVFESANQNNSEPNWYIYHSDHLGSSSFLTDASGTPTQHLQYLPFGENYIEQRATTDYYTPYTFSAKERDPETGYSYFGARYYDPNVSVWLSVDPMADKYPSTSAYMYVLGRPTALIDPNGLNAWKPPTEEGGVWTAEAGDSPGSLARDAKISQSEAEEIMRNHNVGKNRSSDIMVYKGDQVRVPSKSNTSSSSTEPTLPKLPLPQPGTCNPVSFLGTIFGDIPQGVLQEVLTTTGMDEVPACYISAVAVIGIQIFIAHKMPLPPAAKGGINTVDDLFAAGSKLPSVKGGAQISVKGNIDDVFKSLSNGVKTTNLPNGRVQAKLPDGTILTKYPASSGSPSIQVNQGGILTKVRFE